MIWDKDETTIEREKMFWIIYKQNYVEIHFKLKISERWHLSIDRPLCIDVNFIWLSLTFFDIFQGRGGGGEEF